MRDGWVGIRGNLKEWTVLARQDLDDREEDF